MVIVMIRKIEIDRDEFSMDEPVTGYLFIPVHNWVYGVRTCPSLRVCPGSDKKFKWAVD